MKEKNIKCASCKKDAINDGWTYCPYCGEALKKGPLYAIGMQDVAERMLYGLQKSLMKKLFITLKDTLRQEEESHARGFTVKITSDHAQSHAKMERSTKTTWKETDMTISKNRPVPKETIEPETNIVKLPDRLKIDVSLPGIGCIDDIDVLEFKNSSEIRAYIGDTLYFKIIEKPQDLNLSEKKLCNDTFSLEFTRE
ncbi:MAG: hypothetical protein ABIG84_00490 [archaeon]